MKPYKIIKKNVKTFEFMWILNRLYYVNFRLQVDRRMRGLSIRGFSYPRLDAARKQNWQIKEINGS